MCTCEQHATTTYKRYQSSHQLTHSKSRQQLRDLREGVTNKRERINEASYRPDSNPELIHEQDATLHIGNDGSLGPASEGAAAKSDDRSTLTIRPSDCYPGSVHWMSSLDIRFIHDTLKERFRPFSETRRSPFVETSILDTMGKLLAGDRRST